jgi:hypothetical protein
MFSIKTEQQYLNAQRMVRDELSQTISSIIYWRKKLQKDRFICKGEKRDAIKALISLRVRFKEEVYEIRRFNNSWLDRKTIGYLISNIDFERYHQIINSIYVENNVSILD